MTEVDTLKQAIRDIINEMQDGEKTNVQPLKGERGIFDDVNDAIYAAKQAQLKYEDLLLEDRKAVIAAIREQLKPYTQEYAEKMVEESGMGRIPDKKIK